MSANTTTILIKRSFANNTPSTLPEGELAYSFKSNNLFIGNASNSAVLIGGANLVSRVSTVESQISSGASSAAAYNQANTAYNRANTAANTVRVSVNGTGTLSNKQLNFIDSSTTSFSISDPSNGNANIGVAVSSNLFVEVLRANGWIDFTKTLDAAEPPYREGRVWYSTNNKTLMVKSANQEFDSRIGDTLWFYGYNNSGTTIVEGTPVYITGVDVDPTLGNIASIGLADASVYSKKDVVGVTAHDILTGQSGHVLVQGYIYGINTAALSTAQRVHLDWTNPGKLSITPATYPNYPMEVGRCILSDPTNGILYVDVIDHSYEGIRVANASWFDSDLTVGGDGYVIGTQTTTGNIYGQYVHSSGVDLLAGIRSAANTTQVYANNALKVSSAELNFNNTSTIRVGVVSDLNGKANISFDYIGTTGGIASFPTKATGGTVVTANGLNFVNSATVGITVTPGTTGNANISFTTLAGGGTITQVNTGIGLTGGGFTTTGTISANVANTTVQGVTKLIDVVNSNDSANAATANSVKVTFDQATSA
jgi:hypothetical protein